MEENSNQNVAENSKNSNQNVAENSIDVKALQAQLASMGEAILELKKNNNAPAQQNINQNVDVRAKIKEEEAKEAEKAELVKNVELEFKRHNELRDLAKLSGNNYTRILDEYEKFTEKGYLKSEINNLSAKGLLDELLSDPTNKDFIPQSKRSKVLEYQGLNEKQQISQAHGILIDVLPLVLESKNRDNVEKKRAGNLPIGDKLNNIKAQFLKRNATFKGKYPSAVAN